MLRSGRSRWVVSVVAAVGILVGAGWPVPVGAQSLNVYTAWPESFSVPLFKEFTAQTGIKVDFLRFSAGELLARATAERNNPRADVMFGGPGDTYVAAKAAGILEPYKHAAWDRIPAGYKDAEAHFHGFSTLTLVFMTNAKFLKERNLKPPTSWNDLLDPAYKDQIQTADARTSGTAMTRILSIYYALGKDEGKALEYQKKLHQNIQSYTKSGGGGTIPVAMGQAGAGLFHILDAMEVKKKGYDVHITFPKEGVATVIEPVALLKGAKNRELATKFIDWVMSPGMQNLFAKYGIYVIPTHPDAALDPATADLMKEAKLLPVDLDWAGKNRKRLVEQWINEVIR